MTSKPISTLRTGGAYPHLTKLPDPPKPSDAMQQLPHISRVYTTLESYFRQQPDVLVGGDGYLCYDAGDIRRAPRPDCVVAFGVPVPPADIVEANGYTISEIGKSPDFVLEVASQGTGRRDYTVKRDIYAGYGVTEYWRFDHTGGQFHDAALDGDLWSTACTSQSRLRPAMMASCGATARRWGWSCTGMKPGCVSGTRLRENTCPT